MSRKVEVEKFRHYRLTQVLSLEPMNVTFYGKGILQMGLN